MAERLQTPRGDYLIRVAGPPERSGAAAVLTLSLESANGIERVTFRCALRAATLNGGEPIEYRLARWVEAQFETLREAALKSIRSEGRMLQVEFKD